MTSKEEKEGAASQLGVGLDQGEGAPSNQGNRRFVFLMFLVCLFDFADRSVFAVLAQTIKVELELSDLQIGLLQGLAFALLYSTLGLPVARLAERYSRRKIIAICTFFWSCATIWCGVAHNFAQLAIGRAGVGVGEAGFLPAANSMVGDKFPRNRRASMMSLIMLGTPIGILTGALVGGYIASIAGWREAFFVLGVPGAITAGLVWLFVGEPERGKADGVSFSNREAPVPNFASFLRVLVTNKALLFIILGGACAGFGMTSISQFLAVFLSRVHDLDVRDAAKYYGFVSAAFLTLGLLIGSHVTDWLTKFDARWPAWGASIGLAVAPFLLWAALGATDLRAAIILLVAGGTSMLIFYAPTSGMIQNLLEPRMRATGIACFTLCYTLVGSGLGPVFVGFLSDQIAGSHYQGDFLSACPGGVAPVGSGADLFSACTEASSWGVKKALQYVLLVFFISSASYAMASRYMRANLQKSQIPRE